ncbi:MAG: hypothetical protein GF350_05575 [Chitinivibrionales bacterium]|nr:hypothetical protein [Chitinivibrionales bacterium]
MDNSILFLCTGNYYRSRFAEILFNTISGALELEWKAISRGVHCSCRSFSRFVRRCLSFQVVSVQG